MNEQSVNLNPLIEQLRIDEGYVSEPYLCPAGYITYGYGRNLEGNPLTQEEVIFVLRAVNEYGREAAKFISDYLLKKDVEKVRRHIESRHSWILSLDETRALALMNMAYQLGPAGFDKFAPTLALIRAKRFNEAANRLEKQRWYRQSGRRSKRIVAEIRHG